MVRSLLPAALLAAYICVPTASALDRLSFGQQTPRQQTQKLDDQASTIQSNYITDANFTQLKDHANPKEGTFSQRYFFSDEYYKGPGSPVIIQISGEQSAEGLVADLAEDSMMVAMMKTWGAAGVILEHRYFGVSSPYTSLTASNLKFLTVEQAIEDYKYFIENVELPWVGRKYDTHPSGTPWISMGCSYPGLLVALIQQQHPDLFVAGYSSSAPIKADGDFREYWEPIAEGMPKNCSSDLSVAVAHIDHVLSTGAPEEVIKLKTKFGLQKLANEDFGAALQFPLSQWQSLQAVPTPGGKPLFYKLCDTIETKGDKTKNMDAQGVGMPLALENWARAFRTLVLPAIKEAGALESLTTSDPRSPMFEDTSVSDGFRRAWIWMLCNQLGWFQVGGTSSIASSLVNPAYFERQCSNYFPLADGSRTNYNLTQATNKFNDKFNSWNVLGKNLFVTNGEFDPWRSVSFSAPQVPQAATETGAINLIRNATHCWDFSLSNGEYNKNVKKVQDAGLVQINAWLEDWYKNHPDVSNQVPNKLGKTDGFTTETPHDINDTRETVLNDLEDKVEAMAAMKGWGSDFSGFAGAPDSSSREQ